MRLVIEDPESASGSRRKRPDVWEFFVKNGQKALCKVCNSEYTYHGGTSNLRDHFSLSPFKVTFTRESTVSHCLLI